ncbi:MAG: hypothetical protein GY953_51100, partial [bacterium]|nr:hypothetical protein [bacterium]
MDRKAPRRVIPAAADARTMRADGPIAGEPDDLFLFVLAFALAPEQVHVANQNAKNMERLPLPEEPILAARRRFDEV